MLDYVSIIHTGGVVLWKHQFQPLKGDPLLNLFTEDLSTRTNADSNSDSVKKGNYIVKWLKHQSIIITVLYHHFVTISNINEFLNRLMREFMAGYTDPVEWMQEQHPEFNEKFRSLVNTLNVGRKSGQQNAKAEEEDIFDELDDDEFFNRFNRDEPVQEQSVEKKPKVDPIASLDYSKSEEHIESLRDENDTFELDADMVVSIKKKKGKLRSLFSRLTNRILTEDMIEEPLATFEGILIERNVAATVAAEIIEHVKAELIGVRVGSFESIRTAIKDVLNREIAKILTPSREIDIMREVTLARQENRVLSIVMCGVNGVGKSTTLAKIAYWLSLNDVSVMVAACDTFRSGAIEQLNKHCRALGLEMFDAGYGKDPSHVTRLALQHAASNDIEVVLVDTAGRMQDNGDLMNGLYRLVQYNNPDFVFFVGEALVGNDGIDQLRSFDGYLKSKTQPVRGVNGIILTKVDTIDEKIGAALSMVHETKVPIVFLGVGQQRTDLRRLKVQQVVDLLLS
ncbi:hypothetical protein PCE1_004136 [Barthelona sp. PCE]